MFGSAAGQRELVYVRLPDRSTRGVPAWMFDEAICATIRTTDRPVIDSGALLRLARLLDSQRGGERSAGYEPAAALPQNSASDPSEPTGVASVQRRAIESTTSKRRLREVHGFVPRTAAGRSAPGKTSKGKRR